MTLRVDYKAAHQIWAYASVIAFLIGIYMIRKTLFVFVVALMFAYLLYPLVDAIDRRLGWKSRLFALVLPFSLIFGFLFFNRTGLPVGQQFVQHTSELLKLVADSELERDWDMQPLT
jgi:predicted PurR-regulated permease PerM